MAAAAKKKKKSTSAESKLPSAGTRSSLLPATEEDVRVRVFKGHTMAIYRVAMPEDGRFVLTSSEDGTVRQWELADGGTKEGKVVCKGESFNGLAVTADGSHAAAGDENGNIRMINLSINSVLSEWNGHDNVVRRLAFCSRDTQLLSAPVTGTIRRWHAESGAQIEELKMPFQDLYGVAASVDGSRIVGVAVAEGLAVWTASKSTVPAIFEERVGNQASVSLPADGRFAFIGTGDGTIAKWNLDEGRRVAAFEGHFGGVFAVAVTPDGRFCASSGSDQTVRLWAADTGECLAVLRGHIGIVWGIAITPDARRIASVGDDKTLRVWDIPEAILARVAASRKRGYVNAKVVLLGESRVGKTGIANRIWHDTWKVTDTTHGMEVRRVPLSAASEHRDIQREMWLWDLAGQPEYRLTHQLFMEQTSLAVVVVDRQRDDLFASAKYWQEALGKVTHKAGTQCILVAGRCDEPGQKCTEKEMKEWAAQHGFHGPILTIARDAKHAGIAELRTLIEKLIPWNTLDENLGAPENFSALKDAILAVRESSGAGGVVVKPEELEKRVRKAVPGLAFTPEELRAVTGLLAGEGVLHPLPYGDLVVLNPCWVNSYASTLVKLAGESENQLGHVPLAVIQAGKLPDDGTPRLSKEDETQFLPALVALFLERALAWKQETPKGPMLVFPNYVRLPRTEPPPRPGRTVVYRFTGPLEEIYCTLVVRLHYSGFFSSTKLYRQSVDFVTAAGRLAALTLHDSGESGKLDVYFGDKLDIDVQAAFQQFVDEHLKAKAKGVERVRSYFCPKAKCGKEALDEKAIEAARATKKKDARIFCAHCGTGILVDDVLEQQFLTKEGGDAADAAGRKAGEKISTGAMEQMMVGEVMTLVASVNQAFIPRVVRDEGTDGEIEFFAKNGDSTGVAFRVQLKSGDSYLRKRKDGSEVFVMKAHYERYWTGRKKVPVLLIIRSSEGLLRYMNATTAIMAARKKAPGEPVKQIVFKGEDFNAEAVLRLRDERVK